MFTANVGSPDRIFRIILGIVLIAVVFLTAITPTGALGIILLIVSAILILTAFIGTCPLYSILRLNTKS